MLASQQGRASYFLISVEFARKICAISSSYGLSLECENKSKSLIAEIFYFPTVLIALSISCCFEAYVPNEIYCASLSGTIREDVPAVYRILDCGVLG